MRYLLIFLLFLSACSRPTELTGEVYIVTAGRETVRLSNSPVYLHKLESVTPFLDLLKTAKPFDVFKDARPLPVAQTVTDAEGRFKLTLPPGRYAIEVFESRKVPGRGDESYWWLVPVTSDRVTLNNSNLINLTP